MIRNQAAGDFHHEVMFYEDDEALARQVSHFLDLDNAGMGIVVATRTHREVFEDHLAGSSFDPETTRLSGRYVSLDAETLLGELLVDNFPDEYRFVAAVESLLETAGTGPVRIFGEMVALLWERGDISAALKLEKLWNRLAENHRFELLCAYPMSVLEGSAPTEAYTRMCGLHTHLAPFRG